MQWSTLLLVKVGDVQKDCRDNYLRLLRMMMTPKRRFTTVQPASPRPKYGPNVNDTQMVVVGQALVLLRHDDFSVICYVYILLYCRC